MSPVKIEKMKRPMDLTPHSSSLDRPNSLQLIPLPGHDEKSVYSSSGFQTLQSRFDQLRTRQEADLDRWRRKLKEAHAVDEARDLKN